MITEVVDKKTGAILFKRDKESLQLEDVIRKVQALEEKNIELENRIRYLEGIKKEDS